MIGVGVVCGVGVTVGCADGVLGTGVGVGAVTTLGRCKGVADGAAASCAAALITESKVNTKTNRVFIGLQIIQVEN